MEIYFETFRFVPKGVLWQRAVNFSLILKEANFRPNRQEDVVLTATYELVRHYAHRQKYVFSQYEKITDIAQAKGYIVRFMSIMKPYLQAAKEIENQIRIRADDSELYRIVLDILREHEELQLQDVAIKKYVKSERRKLERKRDGILGMLKVLCGTRCTACGSDHNLTIDHIQALSLDGSSEYTNLQLLCSFCNTRKHNRSMAYLHKRLNIVRNNSGVSDNTQRKDK